MRFHYLVTFDLPSSTAAPELTLGRDGLLWVVPPVGRIYLQAAAKIDPAMYTLTPAASDTGITWEGPHEGHIQNAE